MPKLNQLSCTIEMGTQARIKLAEYHTRYTDGSVQTYFAVPTTDLSFHICLTVHGFVAPGLVALVFIDGQYQCRRTHRGQTVDDGTVKEIFLRHKEDPLPNGNFIAREWKFAKLKRADPEPRAAVRADFADNVGTIEVVILRCQPDENPTKGPSSHLLPKPRPFKVKTAPIDSNSQVSKTSSRRASSMGGLGGMFGLFDGAGDEPTMSLGCPNQLLHDEQIWSVANMGKESRSPRLHQDFDSGLQKFESYSRNTKPQSAKQKNAHTTEEPELQPLVDENSGISVCPAFDVDFPQQQDPFLHDCQVNIRHGTPGSHLARSPTGSVISSASNYDTSEGTSPSRAASCTQSNAHIEEASRTPRDTDMHKHNRSHSGFDRSVNRMCLKSEVPAVLTSNVLPLTNQTSFEFADLSNAQLDGFGGNGGYSQVSGPQYGGSYGQQAMQHPVGHANYGTYQTQNPAARYHPVYLDHGPHPAYPPAEVDGRGVHPAQQPVAFGNYPPPGAGLKHQMIQPRFDSVVMGNTGQAMNHQLRGSVFSGPIHNHGGRNENDGHWADYGGKNKQQPSWGRQSNQGGNEWDKQSKQSKQKSTDRARSDSNAWVNNNSQHNGGKNVWDIPDDDNPHNKGANDWDNSGGKSQRSGRGKSAPDWGNDNTQAKKGGHEWGATSQKSQPKDGKGWDNDKSRSNHGGNDWDAQSKGKNSYREGGGWDSQSKGKTSNRDGGGWDDRNEAKNYHHGGAGWDSQSKGESKDKTSTRDGGGWDSRSKSNSFHHGGGGTASQGSIKGPTKLRKDSCNDTDTGKISRFSKSTSPQRDIKTYWKGAHGSEPIITMGPHDPYIYPAGPAPVRPVGMSTEVTYGVQYGRGCDYEKDMEEVALIDDMEDPYAVFTFKYRSQATLEKKLGRSINDVCKRVAMEAERAKLSAMKRDDLVAELLDVKLRSHK